MDRAEIMKVWHRGKPLMKGLQAFFKFIGISKRDNISNVININK